MLLKSNRPLILLVSLFLGLNLVQAQTEPEELREIFLRDQAGQSVAGCAWAAIPDDALDAARVEAELGRHSDQRSISQRTLTRITEICDRQQNHSSSDSILIPKYFQGLLAAVDQDGRWAHLWINRSAREEPATLLFAEALPLQVDWLLPAKPAPFQLYLRQFGSFDLLWVSELTTSASQSLRLADLATLGCQLNELYWLGVRGPGFRQSEVAVRPSHDRLTLKLDLRDYERLEVPILGAAGPQQFEFAYCQWSGLEPRINDLETVDRPDLMALRRQGNSFFGLCKADLQLPVQSSACFISSVPELGRLVADDYYRTSGVVEFPPEKWPVASRTVDIRTSYFDESDADLEIRRIVFSIDDVRPVDRWRLSGPEALTPSGQVPGRWHGRFRCCPESRLEQAQITLMDERFRVINSYLLGAVEERWHEGALDLSRRANSKSTMLTLIIPEAETDEGTTLWTETRRIVPDADTYTFSGADEHDQLVVLQQGTKLSRPIAIGTINSIQPVLNPHFDFDLQVTGLQFDRETKKKALLVLEGSSLAPLALCGQSFGEDHSYFVPLEMTPERGTLLVTASQEFKVHLEGLIRGNLKVSVIWPGSAGLLEVVNFKDLSANPNTVVEADRDQLESVEMDLHNATRSTCSIYLLPSSRDQVLFEKLDAHFDDSYLRIRLAPGEKRSLPTFGVAWEYVTNGRRVRPSLERDLKAIVVRPVGEVLVISERWRRRLGSAATFEVALLFSAPQPSDALSLTTYSNDWRQFEVFVTQPGFDELEFFQSGDRFEVRVCAFLPRREPDSWDRWKGHDFVELFRLPATALNQEQLEDHLELIERRLKTQSWSWAHERESWECPR